MRLISTIVGLVGCLYKLLFVAGSDQTALHCFDSFQDLIGLIGGGDDDAARRRSPLYHQHLQLDNEQQKLRGAVHQVQLE